MGALAAQTIQFTLQQEETSYGREGKARVATNRELRSDWRSLSGSSGGAGRSTWRGRCNDLEPDGLLQIIYGIDGRPTLTEEALYRLEGYRQSTSVRAGNKACYQCQLDIYGEWMDVTSLLMPLLRCISPHDPRWLSTWRAMEETLSNDSPVYR